MAPPTHELGDGIEPLVPGYGDANAHFHLIGDHPGTHGGEETGVPFTGSTAGRRLQPVLYDVGFLADSYADRPTATNLFASYLHMVTLPDGREPTETEYAELERFFDAELRAIAAHVLLPVGERAIRHVLDQYTARAELAEEESATLHAREISGSGWLVVPIREPDEWTDTDAEKLRERLDAVLERDYRQRADLSRFLTDDERYEVR